MRTFPQLPRTSFKSFDGCGAFQRDSDLIFVGKHWNQAHDFRHGFNAACTAAGLEGVTFHTLRHTSCSRLARTGVDILAIAEHAGHRSLTMTRRYSHLCIRGRANTINNVFA